MSKIKLKIYTLFGAAKTITSNLLEVRWKVRLTVDM